MNNHITTVWIPLSNQNKYLIEEIKNIIKNTVPKKKLYQAIEEALTEYLINHGKEFLNKVDKS
jgi:hypothetical protein